MKENRSHVTPLEYALWQQLAAERAPRRKELTTDELVRRSGINRSTIVRLFSPNYENVRSINVVQLTALAEVFGISVHELVRRAEERLPAMSEADDELSERRRKQADVAEWTAEEVDNYAGPKAAIIDPEMDTDEPEQP